MGMRWGEGLKTMGNVIGNMAQQSRADRIRLEEQAREDKYRADMMGLQQQQITETARAAGVREQLAQESHDLAQAQVYTDLLAGDPEISQERRDALVQEAPGLGPFLMETTGQPARRQTDYNVGPFLEGMTERQMLPATPSTYRVGLTGEDRRAEDLRAHQIAMVGVEAQAERDTATWMNKLPVTDFQRQQLANARERIKLDESGYKLDEERIALDSAKWKFQKEDIFTSEQDKAHATSLVTLAQTAIENRNNTFASYTKNMVGYTGYGDLTEAQRNELERLDQVAEQARVHAFNEVSKWTGVDLSAPGTITQGGGAASGANGMVDVHTPTPPATPPATPTQQPQTYNGGRVPDGYIWDPELNTHRPITAADVVPSFLRNAPWDQHGQALGRSWEAAKAIPSKFSR